MNPSRCSKKSGFTLIELIIAIAIFSFISIGIYQAITQTYKIREVLLVEGDFFNGIRLAMGVLEKDVALLYSPILMAPDPQASPTAGGVAGGPLGVSGSVGSNARELGPRRFYHFAGTSDPELQRLKDSPLGRASLFWGSAVSASGLKPSRFMGNSDKISFIAASRVRIYRDAPESEFSRLVYDFKPDPMPESEELKGTQVLFKTESPNVFEDKDLSQDKFKIAYPILFGVRSHKFRFYRSDREQWVPQWDTESSETYNVYPDIVELSFEVVGPARMRHEAIYRFRPENPLNGIGSTF